MLNNKNNDDDVLTTKEYMAAAALSGSFMVLCTNPIWLIKTRIQVKRDGADDVIYLF